MNYLSLLIVYYLINQIYFNVLKIRNNENSEIDCYPNSKKLHKKH